MTLFHKIIQIPRFYPAEYALVLITSLVSLFAASSLAAILIGYWLDTAPSVLADLNVLFVLAVLIVALPVHVLLYVRVRSTSRAIVTDLSLRVASAALAVYLFAAAAAIAAFAVGLLMLWLNAWMGAGSVDRSLLAATLSLVVAIGFFKYAALHFLRTRAITTRPGLYVLIVGVVGLALIVLGLAYPARAYRDGARDFVKENDIAHIQQAVGAYVDQHGDLPARLQELKLDDGTTRRLHDYHYVQHGSAPLGVFGYTLCATFATSGHDFGFPAHESGQRCAPYVAISGSLLEQGLVQYVAHIEGGAEALWQQLEQYLQGAEAQLGGQISSLERHLESVVASSGALQQEMRRLESYTAGLSGDTGQLNEDMAGVAKFVHDLLCGLDPQCTSSQ